MLDDVGDASKELGKMRKDIDRLISQSGSGGGDGSHAGSGDLSVQIGDSTNAAGSSSVAIGQGAWAEGTYGVALGQNSFVPEELTGSAALGPGSTATRDNQASVGQPFGEVYVSGRLVLEPANELGPQPFHPGDPDAPLGAFAVDDDYIYVNTADGWKRSALSSF